MTIHAIRDYPTQSKDREENFHGARLFFIGWDKHLMFYAPLSLCLPQDMPFQAVLTQVLAQAYGDHLEFREIDWSVTTWLKNGLPWQPELDASLVDNGLHHKDLIRFQTSGLAAFNQAGF